MERQVDCQGGRLPLAWNGHSFDVTPYLVDGASGKAATFYCTDLGALFSGDCLDFLPMLRDEVIDTTFADPPFNLGKTYGAKSNDELGEREYIDWCKQWLQECARVTKQGGSLFVYNLPKWNMVLGAFLTDIGMTFRHWIAVEINSCLPIPGRLYPCHYSLLYFTKGKPKTFRRIRTPIQLCRHCGKEVKDYGGHRDAMNPKGVTLKDVWSDVPPVRHWKFKSKKRRANALSTKILDRVVEMTTLPGEVLLDPFGGSGTSYVVCENKGRKWIGVELDFAAEVAERLEMRDIACHENDDLVDE